MILSIPSNHLLLCPVRGFVERHGERFLCLLVVALNHCLVALPNTKPDNFLMFFVLQGILMDQRNVTSLSLQLVGIPCPTLA